MNLVINKYFNMNMWKKDEHEVLKVLGEYFI